MAARYRRPRNPIPFERAQILPKSVFSPVDPVLDLRIGVNAYPARYPFTPFCDGGGAARAAILRPSAGSGLIR